MSDSRRVKRNSGLHYLVSVVKGSHKVTLDTTKKCEIGAKMLLHDSEFRAMSRRFNEFRKELPRAMAYAYRDMVVNAIVEQTFKAELLDARPYSRAYEDKQTTDEYWRETSLLLRRLMRADTVAPILSSGDARSWGFSLRGYRRRGHHIVPYSLIVAVLEDGSAVRNVKPRPLLQMVYDEKFTPYVQNLTGRLIQEIQASFYRTSEGKRFRKIPYELY